MPLTLLAESHRTCTLSSAASRPDSTQGACAALRRKTPTAAARANRSATVYMRAEAGPSSQAGRAKMHDFCMTIPYGAITAAAGVVSLLFGARTFGVQVAAAGLAVCLASLMSLQAWKAGGSSRPYTLLSGALGAYLALNTWPRVQQGLAAAPWPAALLLFSGALVLFCAYNVLAGGNPPPSSKKVATS